jgi:hypothetical protein
MNTRKLKCVINNDNVNMSLKSCEAQFNYDCEGVSLPYTFVWYKLSGQSIKSIIKTESKEVLSCQLCMKHYNDILVANGNLVPVLYGCNVWDALDELTSVCQVSE